MSFKYDKYLEKHRSNVRKAFNWFTIHMPEILGPGMVDVYRTQICEEHDASKGMPDEYAAYDAYFYGGSLTNKVKEDFNRAWLMHIHRNPHHWQHWVLINDEAAEGVEVIEMPLNYIIEMICDWWSFSWAKDNLNEIFSWYKSHKNIKLHPNTRKTVETILDQMETILKEN